MDVDTVSARTLAVRLLDEAGELEAGIRQAAELHLSAIDPAHSDQR
jgi:hypothetical protein